MLSDEEKKKIEEEEKYRAKMRLESSKKPESAIRRIYNKVMKLIAITVFSIAGLIALIGILTSSSTKEPAKVKKVYAPLTCKEFCKIFNGSSSLSKLQKDEYIKKVKGNYAKWTGEVREIAVLLTTITVQVRCLASTSSSDVIISFQKNEKEKLMELMKGDKIDFEARIDDYGTFLPHSLSDGILIKKH